jgi:hypothetical protein
MTVRLVSDTSNVLAFPGKTRARPSVELITELAPSRSLVDTLIAERGDQPHDAWAGFAREFAFQARTLEIGHGRDVAIMRLRGLVDAHIAHAVDLCRAYRDVADRMVSLEVRTAQMERVTSPMLVALRAARGAGGNARSRDHRQGGGGWGTGCGGGDGHLYPRGSRSIAGQRRGAASASAVHDRGGLTAVPDLKLLPDADNGR